MADPRYDGEVFDGTPLRDGAVDPQDPDFLGPTNAGAEGELGNPHGPHVVNPGIHASENLRPVRPGPVSSDPATQSAQETAHLTEHVFEDAAAGGPEPDPEPDPEDGGA